MNSSRNKFSILLSSANYNSKVFHKVWWLDLVDLLEVNTIDLVD